MGVPIILYIINNIKRWFWLIGGVFFNKTRISLPSWRTSDDHK